MYGDEKISVRAFGIWREKGMPDGKYLLRWGLACRSMEGLDRNGKPSAAASGGSKAGDRVGHETESLA